MSIENDLQSRFRNEWHKAAVNLMYTHHWLIGHIKTCLAEFDLTPQQYNVLRILNGSFPKPLSTTQIRERMIDRASDASRIVDRLVAKQLVTKHPSQTDCRLVEVYITPYGQTLMCQMEATVNRLDGIMAALNEDEVSQLNRLLEQLRAG